ncbi:MAG: glycosyltransferase family 2 protein, partial [Cyanobacteria bacterium P01_A01_bin.114]
DIQVKHLKDWRCLSLLRAEIFYRALPWTALLMRLKANHPEDYQRFTRDLNLQFSSQVSVVLTFTLVAAAVMGPFWQSGYALASLSACGLLLLNLPVYRFFAHKRGILFALRVVPWHWFYYLYAGACFAVGLVRHNLVELRVLPRLTAAFKPHSS